MGGFALVMIGMAVMLVAPLQRVTAGLRAPEAHAIAPPLEQGRHG
jgi:hypothetical protein